MLLWFVVISTKDEAKKKVYVWLLQRSDNVSLGRYATFAHRVAHVAHDSKRCNTRFSSFPYNTSKLKAPLKYFTARP